jgi:hypothetical protein
MPVLARTRASAVVAVLVLAACGGEDDTQVSSEPPPWRATEIDGVPHADIPAILATDGEDVLALFLAEDGLLHAASADGSGSVTTGTPTDLALAYPGIGGVVRFDGRWLALTSGRAATDDIVYEVRVLESTDGLAWREVSATGLGGPAEVGGLVVAGDRLVAVGTARTEEEPTRGGFLPIAWSSADGRTWERVDLPIDGAAEGGAVSAIYVGDRVLAGGRADARGMLWESADGVTWTAREDDEVDATSTIGGLVGSGGVVLASVHVETPELGEHGEMGRAYLLRSTDDGESWTAVEPPAGTGDGYPTGVRAGGGWFFVSKDGRQAAYETAHCYADIEYCRNPPMIGGSLFASRDGLSWDRVDTRGISDPGSSGAISGTRDGAVVLLASRVEGSVLWVWPGSAELAFREGDAVPSPPDTTGIEVVDYDDELEVGRREAMPLGGHCGYRWTSADDRLWQLDGEEVYDFPDDWPANGDLVYAYVTLVAEDRLEFSLEDGEVIATFSPATEPAPGCA